MENITVKVVEQDRYAILTFNRPKARNAFDPQMITEITNACQELDKNANISTVIFRGSDNNFCAGADLNWMQKSANYSHEQNLADAKLIYTLMTTVANLQKVTIAVAEGAVFGGGLGILAACDIGIGCTDAMYCFSEVKLGLAPAVITPFVVASIGVKHARRWMLTAEVFNSTDAYTMNLISEVLSPEEIERYLPELIAQLKKNGPQALLATKNLLNKLSSVINSDPQITTATIELIANLRASNEGQEGLNAFLSKTAPSWTQ